MQKYFRKFKQFVKSFLNVEQLLKKKKYERFVAYADVGIRFLYM